MTAPTPGRWYVAFADGHDPVPVRARNEHAVRRALITRRGPLEWRIRRATAADAAWLRISGHKTVAADLDRLAEAIR